MIECVKALQAEFECFDSVSFRFFSKVKSKLLIPGPENNRRPLLPIVFAIVLPTNGSSAGDMNAKG